MFKFERNTPKLPIDTDLFPWWHESKSFSHFVHMLGTGVPLTFDEFVIQVVQYNQHFPDSPMCSFSDISQLPLVLIRLIECGVCKVVGEAWWEEGVKKPVPSDELGDFY